MAWKLLRKQLLVAKRLGKKGLREFQDNTCAHQVADTFKRLELSEPKDLAIAVATNDKNFFGSVVSVEERDCWVEIRREKCAINEGINAFARLGAGLVAKQHCKTCVESHWRKVFADLGMSYEIVPELNFTTLINSSPDHIVIYWAKNLSRFRHTSPWGV